MHHPLVGDALVAVSEGRVEAAKSLLDEAMAAPVTPSSDNPPVLAVALARHLAAQSSTGGGEVYDSPAAFQAFINAGGNIGLYAAVSESLASRYDGVDFLLDIGAGDGHALIPALRMADDPPRAVTVVEPAAEMAKTCRQNLSLLVDDGVIEYVDVVVEPIEQYLGRSPGRERHWDCAQATFSLHRLEPNQRQALIGSMASQASKLMIAEFDAPDFAGLSDRTNYLAARYEMGLAEYTEGPERDLVADGFLIPVLLDQLNEHHQRTSWEQPIERWVDEITATANFADVQARQLYDYWWAPAHLVTANAILTDTDVRLSTH